MGTDSFTPAASNSESDTKWSIKTFIRKHLDFLYANNKLHPHEALSSIETTGPKLINLYTIHFLKDIIIYNKNITKEKKISKDSVDWNI